MSGIDYGRGLTNIDHKTGVRFGVISQNECLQAWADSSEAIFPVCECGEGDCRCMCDPIAYVIKDDEYFATCGEDGDIFIERSPYYTLCTYCSPCAPGASYLMSPGDVKAYCFGHDFFEDERAPYPVYSVKTGEEVLP